MRVPSMLLVPVVGLLAACGGSNVKVVRTGLPNNAASLSRLEAGGIKYGCRPFRDDRSLQLGCAKGDVTFIADSGALVAGCRGGLRDHCAEFVSMLLDAGGEGGVGVAPGPVGPATPAGPNPAFRPPGNGWHCFSFVSSGVTACERSYTTCDGMRLQMQKKYPVTECSPRLSAHCHTFVGNNGAAVLSCWGSALDCTEAAKGANGASTCAQWD